MSHLVFLSSTFDTFSLKNAFKRDVGGGGKAACAGYNRKLMPKVNMSTVSLGGGF